jgi:ribosome-binding protein aMBF1 (putative translation factor)
LILNRRYDNDVIYDATIATLFFELANVNYKYNEAYCKSFGKQLRSLRQSKGVSMRKLALQADMEYSQLSKIERGAVNTTISTVYALSNALEIPMKQFFDFRLTWTKAKR